ncbi:hypothetical protein ACVWWO_005634 [Bradyrhizobium sp. F1.13.1]
MKTSIEWRLLALEQRNHVLGRQIHFIKATDTADSDRQIAKLQTEGAVGPRDGFLCLAGWMRT